MYLVELINDNKRTTIHYPNQSKVKLTRGTVKKELNTIYIFNFTVNLGNPAWELTKPLKTLIEVTDVKRNKLVFKGRILDPTGEMSSNGAFSKSFIAEDEKAYLRDTIQRHLEFRGTLKEYFRKLLERHNEQVPDNKKIYPGDITVIDNNDYVYFYASYDTTWNTIQEDLIESYGGYLFLRYGEDGKRYLDYLTESGETKEMSIELAKNMQSISNALKPSQIITRLIPLGQSIESVDEEATDASQARLNISSINNGKDYIDDVALIVEFGIVEGTVVWNEVTNLGTLKSKGEEWLKNQRITNTITLDALNLALIDERYDDFEIGDYYTAKNNILGIDDSYQLIAQSIDILFPQKSDLTFGDNRQTFEQYQTSMKKSQINVSKLQSVVNVQSTKLLSITNQVNEVQKNIISIETILEDADLQVISQQLTELSNGLSAIQNSINQLPTMEAINDLQGQVNTLQDNLKALNTAVATNYQDAELRFANIEQRLSVLEGA